VTPTTVCFAEATHTQFSGSSPSFAPYNDNVASERCGIVFVMTALIACGDNRPSVEAEDAAPAVDGEAYKLVAAGGLHACAIGTNDKMYCWGANGRALTSTIRTQPTAVGTDTWISVEAGGAHTYGVRADHTLWRWSGNGLEEGAVQVGAEADWTSISVGAEHSCGIRNSGQLWCWGANTFGQLGDGTTESTELPFPVVGGPWAQVSVGGEHTCAIDSLSKLWCWGANYGGELGVGPGQYVQHVPTEVSNAIKN
jgi:hypothetical protein